MAADFGLPKRSPLGVVRWGGRSHLNRRHAPQAEFGLPPALLASVGPPDEDWPGWRCNQKLFWYDILVSFRRSRWRNDRHRRVGGRQRLTNPSIPHRGRTNHARFFALTLRGWERGLGRRCQFPRRARCDITCCRMAGLDLCWNCGLCGRRRPWHGEGGLAVNRSAKQQCC
jgi:hypothetical protein